MNKKIKENKYKPEARNIDAAISESGFGIDFCLKCIMTVAIISLISLASIFIYDFITQSTFFNVQNVQISGESRATEDEIKELANLKTGINIFELNLFSVKKQIISHPWIQSAIVKRQLPSSLVITIIEQQVLAIVKIENLADILINIQGRPFKEYDPLTDKISNLPVISGLDLTSENNEYQFNGPLFNSIMDFLGIQELSDVKHIKANIHTGIIIETKDVYNREPLSKQETLQIKLGFDGFQAKLNRAKKISEYIDKNFPERIICTMDLFNIEKVFIKTKRNDALHNTLEKGV
ncbi:MAG: FtsQ-type POTRA domain-containing protein [Pseudomonadota bacterium]